MKPKVVLLGAGSFFFGRQFIWSMVHSEVLRHGVAILVDTDETRLNKMVKLAQKVISINNSPLKLEWSCNHLDVLKDADFIILSFSNKGVHYREIDCRLAEKYGIRLCCGDTIGPGGVFKTLRELPTVLNIANDIERICPDAWVINYVNPAAVIGLGLARYTKLKVFSLCDGLYMPYIKKRYLKMINKENDDVDKLDLTIAGTNHFTWLLDIKYNGEDVSSDLRKHVESLALEDEQSNFAYSIKLWDVYGAYPAIIEHIKEYVPFWQGRGMLDDKPATLEIFDAQARRDWHAKMWEEVDAYVSGTTDIKQFNENYQHDVATDVIENMWINGSQQFYISTLNNGAVPNLPDNAFIEILCDVSMNGPIPKPAVLFPVGLHSLQMQVLDAHELTVEAVVKKDKNILRRALLRDPLTVSITDTDAMIKDFFNEEREALPIEWF